MGFTRAHPPVQHEIRLSGAMGDPRVISTLNFEIAVTYNLIVSDTAIPNTEQVISAPVQ
ncbi:MAG: hypothetical protein M3299_17745 [Thermoproteota archaeon]|nr:hypothetical protein [Thermoproteota archaeon]